jgi:hypothetical protein
MLYRRTAFLALPAIAALMGTAAVAPATAQTVVTTTAPFATTQSTIVVAPSAPPPPQVEAVPPPPTTATVTTYWQPGHWNWNGSSWVWVDGTYMQRVQQPTAAAVWVPGQWAQQAAGGYVWVAGHWQS